MRSRNWRGFLAGIVTLGLVAFAAPAHAQQTGAITGTVVRQSNQQPLETAQVLVVGTGLGTITDADGEYRISQVPAGQHQVRVQLVGYEQATQTVTVEAGQAATVDFVLNQSAVELDELVVTGTGTGGVERKRLGNTIGSINTDDLEDSPTQNFSELIQAREPGVNIGTESGLAGEGSKIRIRGSASLSQSNEPLVYIDGMRASTGGGFAGDVSSGDAGTGASSRLDDIPPESIERVEILKGAAAATLYGTEASNGVIQIFTKAGSEGSARWNFEVANGIEVMPTNRIIPHADFPRNQTQAERMQQRWGADVEPFELMKRPILEDVDEVGRTTTLSGSVNGGSEGVTYFGSGRYQNLDGIFGLEELGPARDHSERWNGTLNMNAFPTDKIEVQGRVSYTHLVQESPETANNTTGVWPMMFMAQPRLANCSDHSQPCNFYGTPVFVTPEEAMQQVTEQEVNRLSGSFQTTYQASSSLTVNAKAGVDFHSNNSSNQAPFGWNVDNFGTSDVKGNRTVGSGDKTIFTAELRGGWETEIGPFGSSLTFGSQGFLDEKTTRGGTGQNFAGPGLEVASAASNQTVDESFVRSVNIGTFAQDQLEYRDFVFVTLGGRWDVNSAFGKELTGEFYPKTSFSVIPSDLSGWDSSLLSTFRIRGAFGESGLQPGQFDQFRTFSGLGSSEGPGIEPDNLGNPNIRPEVSRELEAGIELGLFRDRLAVEATVWDRTTTDALVNRQFAPSAGFESLQLVNIGQLDAQGVDVSVNGTPVRGDDFSVSVFANAAYLNENVTDLGGAPQIKVSGGYPRDRQFLTEGHAPGAFFGAKVQDVPIPLDIFNTCTQPTEEEALDFFSEARSLSSFEVLPVDCGEATLTEQKLGNPTPDWSGSLGGTVTFLEDFELRTVAEFNLGHQHHDLSGAFRQSNALIGRNTPATARIESTVLDPSSTARERLEAAIDWAKNYRGLAPMSGMNQIWDADWVKLREVSLNYDAPFAAGLGMRNLSISLRARNVAAWINDEYRGLDPELEANARSDSDDVDSNFQLGQEAWRLPIPRRFILAVRAGL